LDISKVPEIQHVQDLVLILPLIMGFAIRGGHHYRRSCASRNLWQFWFFLPSTTSSRLFEPFKIVNCNVT
jgi:hypothetical protein